MRVRTAPDGTADWHSMLLTRAWPQRDVLDDFDAWQHSRHLPDLTRLPGAVQASYYCTLIDGLPQAWIGSGSRMAAYTARDTDGLRAWFADPGVPAAVEDGSRFFPHFNELDGDTYTGNVYECAAVAGGSPPAEATVAVERFEVPPGLIGAFDRWLLDEHLPGVAAGAGVLRARAWRAVREAFPVPYYCSAGNRMLSLEVTADAAVATLTASALDARLAASQAWDRRLPYVRRDVYEHVETVRSPHGGAY